MELFPIHENVQQVLNAEVSTRLENRTAEFGEQIYLVLLCKARYTVPQIFSFGESTRLVSDIADFQKHY